MCSSLQNTIYKICLSLSSLPLATHRSTCCNEAFNLALAGLKSMCHEVTACSVLQQLQSECVRRCISSHRLYRTNNTINTSQPHLNQTASCLLLTSLCIIYQHCAYRLYKHVIICNH
jgi:hypothetical protein